MSVAWRQYTEPATRDPPPTCPHRGSEPHRARYRVASRRRDVDGLPLYVLIRRWGNYVSPFRPIKQTFECHDKVHLQPQMLFPVHAG